MARKVTPSCEGDREEAEARARRAYEEGRNAGTVWPLLGARLGEGNLEAAVELARELLSAESHPAPPPIADALGAAVSAAETGDVTRARARLEEAASLAREPGYL